MTIPWYRVVLSFHLIAVISWMAGILYLYRLFIYHTEETEGVVRARFVVMEERLMRIIMIPAMGMALLFGMGMLAMNPSLLTHPWMHVKLLFVVALMFMSHLAGRIRTELREGTSRRTSKRLRILNEVPTLLMIGIVFMVILKPFE